MRRLFVLMAALVLLIGGWQPVQAQHPCICRGREYDRNDETSTYIAYYHEVDCEDFMVIFVDEAHDLPEQTCPNCDEAYMRMQSPAGKSSGAAQKNPAAQRASDKSHDVYALKKKPAQPKQKKNKDFEPKGGGLKAKASAIIKFSLQGEQDPCYVKVFNVEHFDDPNTQAVETSGNFDVGFEIEAVPENEPGLIKYNPQQSLSKVRSLKLNHPDQGTVVVPHHYVVTVGLIEYTVLATR